MEGQYEVVHYIKDNGEDVYQEWLEAMRDKEGQAAIYRAVGRMEKGNFGNHHSCRDGVWELVIDKGPGYRVYYSMIGNVVVLLLCAGSKRTQDKDIERAVTYLRKFKEE